MTWQASSKWLKDAALFLVAPSLLLNMFFMSDVYHTIKSIPERDQQHEIKHIKFESQIADILDSYVTLKIAFNKNEALDSLQERRINRTYYRLNMEVE